MDIEWLTDVGPAEWIKDRMGPFGENVGSVIPSGYAAYARLFHPVEPQGPGEVRRRWRDVAADNGRIVHPEMQFHMISLAPGVLADPRLEAMPTRLDHSPFYDGDTLNAEPPD